MLKISIIIINYNGQLDTEECLESLAKIDSKGLELQVVVVDNNSQIAFKSQKSKSFPYTFEELYLQKNLGFTGGNNVGIEYAFKSFQPDYILLLNNDTTVDTNFLQHLVHFSKGKSDLGAVCPLIYFSKGREFHNSYTKEELGKVVWFAGGSIDWEHMYAFHRGVDEVDRGQFQVNGQTGKQVNKASEVPLINYTTMDFATGCCVLFPTKVLKEVGLFDQSYFLYWEDVDLSQRIREAGYQIYLQPEAIIWHKNAGSTGGSGSTLHQQYQERNRKRFTLKYAPWKKKVAVWLGR